MALSMLRPSASLACRRSMLGMNRSVPSAMMFKQNVNGAARFGAASRAMSEFKFRSSHEYIKIDGSDVGVMGISDFAQIQLGDVVYVELPTVGDTIEQGEFLGSVESVKAASDVFAPVSGEVVEINETLLDVPESVNKGAMSDAWFCKIKMSNLAEHDELMDESEYKKHCEEEQGDH